MDYRVVAFLKGLWIGGVIGVLILAAAVLLVGMSGCDSPCLAHTGVSASPASDASVHPAADEVWDAADGWIDLGIAIAGLFGASGVAATQFLIRARQKSRALREVVAGNEKLKEWLRDHSKPIALDAFYDFQNGEQTGKTEEIVAAERARLKGADSTTKGTKGHEHSTNESGGD